MAIQKPKRIQGKVRSYDATKGGGVILAQNKAFEFYTSDMRYELEAGDLRKNIVVEFLPEEGQKKHYAKAIEIYDTASSLRFKVPDKFIYTRELGFDEWQTIELARETLSCHSAESYADAMNKLVDQAKTFKANALLDLNQFQSAKNKQQPYVCKARPAIVAKPYSKGSHKRADLMGLNEAMRGSSKSGGNPWILWGTSGALLAIMLTFAAVFALR